MLDSMKKANLKIFPNFAFEKFQTYRKIAKTVQRKCIYPSSTYPSFVTILPHFLSLYISVERNKYMEHKETKILGVSPESSETVDLMSLYPEIL